MGLAISVIALAWAVGGASSYRLHQASRADYYSVCQRGRWSPSGVVRTALTDPLTPLGWAHGGDSYVAMLAIRWPDLPSGARPCAGSPQLARPCSPASGPPSIRARTIAGIVPPYRRDGARAGSVVRCRAASRCLC